MSRRTRARAQLIGLVAATAVTASACQIPVNPRDFGIALPVNCTLFILEPASGLITIPLVDGVAAVGCNLAL